MTSEVSIPDIKNHLSDSMTKSIGSLSDNENMETDSNGNNLSDFNDGDKIDGQYSDGSEPRTNGSRSPGDHELSGDHGNSNGSGGVYDAQDSVPTLKCHLCEYETYSQATLQTHFKSHDSDSRKVFQCDICNMKFSNGANMRRHRVRHTGVKPYECKVCQKRFFRKDHLAEHMTTHNKKLPFHCPVCNKGFQRQIAMRAHFQNEHVGHSEGLKTCGLCGYNAGSLKSLTLHMAKRHGIDLDSPTQGPTGGGTQSCENSQQGDAMVTKVMDHSGHVSIVPHHFLTPQVEISVASPSQCSQVRADHPDYHYQDNTQDRTSPHISPSQPSPSSSHSSSHSGSQHSPGDPSSSCHDNKSDSDITPDISLIPIKQEPCEDGGATNLGVTNQVEGCHGDQSDVSTTDGGVSGSGNMVTSSTSGALPTCSVAGSKQVSSVSLIKVSPLKSLLREEPRSLLRPSRTSTGNHGSPGSYVGTNGNHKSSTQCYFCGIMFPDQTLYFLHKGCHSESNPWKCNICGEQCQNVYDFNSHLLSKAHQ